MTRLALLGLLLLGQAWATDHEGGPNFPAGTGGVNAPWQQDKPHLVLVSIDGFRWNYPDLYPTPTISRLISEGKRSERLIPVWPTLTFPNHYTIATGMHPTDHGLVSNTFLDPELGWYRIRDRSSVQNGGFYAGEPIWVTAETQGMVAASFFWVGSEADIQGVHPTHWRNYDKKVSGEERVDQVLAWLAEPSQSRPHMVTLYFEDVDDNAHWHGPGSEKFLQAMTRVDGYLKRLLDGIEALPHADRVNLVLVSDHGQMPYKDETPFVLQEHVDLTGLDLYEGGSFVFAWQQEPDAARAERIAARINMAWQHGEVYTPGTAPPSWQLRDNPRQPHLVFQADPGHAVISSGKMSGKVTAGDHGWAPEVPDMHGIFIAWGQQIDKDLPTTATHATEVHSILLNILGLEK